MAIGMYVVSIPFRPAFEEVTAGVAGGGEGAAAAGVTGFGAGGTGAAWTNGSILGGGGAGGMGGGEREPASAASNAGSRFEAAGITGIGGGVDADSPAVGSMGTSIPSVAVGSGTGSPWLGRSIDNLSAISASVSWWERSGFLSTDMSIVLRDLLRCNRFFG
jgi:hypothetical protein